MPNAWDVGSARLLAHAGFEALATTSSGFAASLGRDDQATTLDELEQHAKALVSAVEIPVSIDAEHGFAREPEDVATTVRRLAETGAAGISIEDYDPTGEIYPLSLAQERIEAAAQAAAESGIVLTARAENHLYGVGDLADTMARLQGYATAGADVVYAPGVNSARAIRALVSATDRPLNVLIQSATPTLAELAELGVRRVSTGGALAFAAYGTLMTAGRELLTEGTHHYLDGVLGSDDRTAFVGHDGV